MGVTKFLIFLLICSIVVLSSTKDVNRSMIQQDKKPIVEFYNSTIYTINTKRVAQTIQAEKTYIYKNSKELVSATIVLNSAEGINTINADNIVQSGDNLYLNGSVLLETFRGLSLKTQSLVYNLSTKIITNNIPFFIVAKENSFTGENLYYDITNNILKAKNIKAQINIQEKL